MRPLAILLTLALASGLSAFAQGSNPDLMKTPECLAARKQLDEAMAAGGPRTRLDAARELAALKCFGARPKAAPEGRFLPPPASVNPAPIPAPVDATPLQLRPAPALPGAAAPPPVTVPRA